MKRENRREDGSPPTASGDDEGGMRGWRRYLFLWWGSLFISVPEKDIPGEAESDEAEKGNPKKDIWINVKKLHGDSQLQ